MVRASPAGTLAGMRQTTTTLARLLALPLAIVAVIVALPQVATAHTDFDYALPAEGASVGEPVSEITVAFTLPVTLVGNGFEVLDPQGDIVEPAVTTPDDTVFTLRLDSPLAGGDVGVRYEVTAEDGHVVSGGFSFTITIAAPVETAPPATDPPATDPPVSALPASEPATAQPAATDPPVAAPAATDDSSGPTDEATVDNVAENPAGDGGSGSGVYIAIAIAVVVAAGAFLLLRSRTSPDA